MSKKNRNITRKMKSKMNKKNNSNPPNKNDELFCTFKCEVGRDEETLEELQYIGIAPMKKMQTSNTLIKEPAFSLFRQMESGNVRVENQTETKDVRDEVVEGLQKLTGSQEVRLQEQSTGSPQG